MTVTCLSFSGVIAEDGLDTQELSVGPTAPIAGKADADLSGAPAGSTGTLTPRRLKSSTRTRVARQAGTLTKRTVGP